MDALVWDALDPERLAAFWAGVLTPAAYDAASDRGTLLPSNSNAFRVRFRRTDRVKVGPNRAHFDLTSDSPEQQRETVERALSSGARRIDVGQGADARHVVLADPEGNEFCVLPAGNTFLAGCGFVGALACDGSQAVGYFWRDALGWPLVWDQDEETAIQSPAGGTKITWGGPPVAAKDGSNRLHFDLTPTSASDHDAELDRLLALGASRIDIGQRDVPWTVLADPDGNEFCLR
nr:VOC family protein [Flexivirga aerilata]